MILPGLIIQRWHGIMRFVINWKTLFLFYLPSIISGWNLFVLKPTFIAMRASSALVWNKAEAELCLNNKAETRKENFLLLQHAGFQQIGSPVATFVSLLAWPSKQCCFMKVEAVILKKMGFCDLSKIPVGLGLCKSQWAGNLKLSYFMYLERPVHSFPLIPRVQNEIPHKSWVWSTFASLLLLAFHLLLLKHLSLSVMRLNCSCGWIIYGF